jgi:hypothetical protein
MDRLFVMPLFPVLYDAIGGFAQLENPLPNWSQVKIGVVCTLEAI